MKLDRQRLTAILPARDIRGRLGPSKIMPAIIGALASSLFAVVAAAQTQSGSLSSSSSTPAWGQLGTTTWGTYSGVIGQNGWNYDQTMRPNEPVGSVLNPNQIGSSFDNSRTGATLFVPQDTRLKGRDRP
jgi:hypothetical protein